MKQKMENFASSEIEAIAEKRGRNAEWAKTAVRESASITAEKALDLHVIDLIATDIPDLLKQLERPQRRPRQVEYQRRDRCRRFPWTPARNSSNCSGARK